MSATKWFHGTDSVAAEKIRIEGLRPNVNRFNFDSLIMENPVNWPETGFVFITAKEHNAQRFAIFRTKYDRTKPNEYFLSNMGDFLPLKKIGKDYHPDAEPVVLELELPPEVVERDPHSHSDDMSFRVRGFIAPECIKKVHHVKDLA